MIEISPPTELTDWIGGGFLFLVGVSYASNNNTSTDFLMILSTE
jgi:hypothetical protein